MVSIVFVFFLFFVFFFFKVEGEAKAFRLECSLFNVYQFDLTLVLLNKDATPTSNFQPIRLLDPDFCNKFTYLMTNSADPDQLASSQKPTDLDLHSLQRQGISEFSRTRVK